MTIDRAAAAEWLIQPSIAPDFGALEKMVAPYPDYALNTMVDGLRAFASAVMPDRHFGAAERVTAAGDIVVRECRYAATAASEMPEIGAVGEALRLKFRGLYALRARTFRAIGNIAAGPMGPPDEIMRKVKRCR